MIQTVPSTVTTVNVRVTASADSHARLLVFTLADDQANSSDTKGEDKLLREIFITKAQVVLALPSSCVYKSVVLTIQAQLVSEF